MGIFKKLFRPVLKDATIFITQAKALIKADKISRGEKVLAPKHPTDEKHFQQAQADPKLKEIVNRHDENLITNMNKISIKSFDPPQPKASGRPLPSREMEFEDKYDLKYEYGFYEPPLDKINDGKVTFREAMELLHAKTELEVGGEESKSAAETLRTHSSKKRISDSDVDEIYGYFRPFVRRKPQQVVSKRDVDVLYEYMNNHTLMLDNMEVMAEFKQLLDSKVDTRPKSQLDALKEGERDNLEQQSRQLRLDESQRLRKSMSQLQEEAAAEATRKEGADSSPAEERAAKR